MAICPCRNRFTKAFESQNQLRGVYVPESGKREKEGVDAQQEPKGCNCVLINGMRSNLSTKPLENLVIP
jgi:hypothetical protein